MTGYIFILYKKLRRIKTPPDVADFGGLAKIKTDKNKRVDEPNHKSKLSVCCKPPDKKDARPRYPKTTMKTRRSPPQGNDDEPRNKKTKVGQNEDREDESASEESKANEEDNEQGPTPSSPEEQEKEEDRDSRSEPESSSGEEEDNRKPAAVNENEGPQDDEPTLPEQVENVAGAAKGGHPEPEDDEEESKAGKPKDMMALIGAYETGDEEELLTILREVPTDEREPAPKIMPHKDVVDFGHDHKFGIILSETDHRTKSTVYIVDKGSQFFTSGNKNKYLMNFMARFTKRVHEANKCVNNLRSLDPYFSDQVIEEVAYLEGVHGHLADISLTAGSRHLKFLKKIFEDYVGEEGMTNQYMMIAIYVYACARTGHEGPYRGIEDEFWAAIKAARVLFAIMHKRKPTNYKNIAGWEMIMAHLLKGDLEAMNLPTFRIPTMNDTIEQKNETMKRSMVVKFKYNKDSLHETAVLSADKCYQLARIDQDGKALESFVQFINEFERNEKKYVHERQLRIVGKDPYDVQDEKKGTSTPEPKKTPRQRRSARSKRRRSDDS